MLGREDKIVNVTTKNAFFLEERVRSLASKGKFYEANKILEELTDDDKGDIGINLLRIDCYLQIGRENKADRLIKRVRTIVMTPPMCEIDDILELADILIEDSCIVRGIILIKIASDMYKISAISPDEVMDGIFHCMQKMQNPTRQLLKPESSTGSRDLQGLLKSFGQLLETGDVSSITNLTGPKKEQTNPSRNRIIAIDFGVEYMLEMLNDLRELKGANSDKITLKIAWCTNYIGYNYAQVDEHRKTLKVLQIGIDALEKHFEKQSCSYKVYGTLLTNKGTALHNLQKYTEAERVKLQSLEAKEAATDYTDQRERREEIETIAESIKITRQHMKM